MNTDTNNEKEKELELKHFSYVYTFTQTVTGYALATAEEHVKNAVLSNFGDWDNFELQSITELSEDEIQAIMERMDNKEVLN